MLDTLTLRVDFAVMSCAMLALFYVTTYRSTRAAYCGWWCLSLILFLFSSAAFMLDGTWAQAWANPLGNALGVAGAATAWAGAASLRHRRPPPWQLLAPSAIAAVTGALDDPAHNRWAGGGFFLALMALLLAVAGREMWLCARQPAETPTHRTLTRTVALGATVLALFYVGRWAAYVTRGPESHLFRTVFGSVPTTMLTMVMLVVISVSMSSLSNEQQLGALRAWAGHDDLTGLLTRGEFRRLAAEVVYAARRTGRPATVVMADLDEFKQINDQRGHAVGDRVLKEFGAACHAVLRGTDLAARLGGEEFCLLLPDTSPAQAERIADRIAGQLRAFEDGHTPTVSFGIATTDPRIDLDATLEYADAALYRAKAAGRNRIERHA